MIIISKPSWSEGWKVTNEGQIFQSRCNNGHFLARNPNDPSVKWSSYILLLDLLIYWFRCIFQIMKYYLRPILACRKIEIYLKNQSMLLDFTNTSELWQKPRKRILRACLVFWQSLNINPCFPPTQTHNTVSSTATASGCHWDFLRRK